MSAPRAALIVAPFWRQQGHVGVYRVDRFVRWLASAGVKVHVVCGGDADGLRETPWGSEITVRDRLGLYRSAAPSASRSSPAPTPRRPNLLRRRIAHSIFVPDPSIGWALRAARHELVRCHDGKVSWVISTSPPESSHLAAYIISRRSGARLAVDMRDGWLDEPLREVLLRPGVRRSLEARLERRILTHASSIFVTSQIWWELLAERIDGVSQKTTTLTNGYPSALLDRPPVAPRATMGELLLLHAGRFSGSHQLRSVATLLRALHAAFGADPAVRGTVSLLGQLETDDLASAAEWQERLGEVGWQLRVEPPLPRAALFERYREADGLLLLSASRAAVPSKLFEYIPTRRPILAISPEGSAVRLLAADLPQLFVTSGGVNGLDRAAVASFVRASAQSQVEAAIPAEFGEASLSAEFLKALGV